MQHLKQQQETNVLLHAAERGMDWTSLDGRLALALATAAQATIDAEQKALEQRILECRHLLITLEDSRDDALGRGCEASYQLGTLLDFFENAGISMEGEGEIIEPSSLLLENDADNNDPDDSSSIGAPSEFSCSASEESTSDKVPTPNEESADV